jgi:hypothetical protein
MPLEERVRQGPAPSISAASYSSGGSVRMNPARMNTATGSVTTTSTRISPVRLLRRPSRSNAAL